MRRLFVRLIHAALYPALAPSRAYSTPALAIVIGLLILTGALAFPPLKDWLFCRLGLFDLPKEDRESLKNWCDSIVILCQLILVLVVGGIVVTDSLTKGIVRVGEQIREEIDSLIAWADIYGPLTSRQARLHALMKELEGIEVRIEADGLWTLPSDVRRAFRIVQRIYSLFDIGEVNRIAGFFFSGGSFGPLVAAVLPFVLGLQMRITAAFPGGLQGLIGFVAFWVMIMAGMAKMFLDYPAACVILV